MQWPWVSRRAYDLILADRDWWRARALPERVPPVVEWRNAQDPVPIPPPPTWDEIGAAISHRAGTNGPLRAHLAAYAQQQRIAGATTKGILRSIVDWHYRPEEPSPTADRERADAEAHVASLLD
jgi:hypothetical protein